MEPEPCLHLCTSLRDLCCWGRRPRVPIELYSFCDTHAIQFMKYLLVSFFGHAAKTALFVSTHNAFYILFKKDFLHYFVTAWKAKALPQTASGGVPLHFKKTSSGVLTQDSVLLLLRGMDQFCLSCIVQTPLSSIDVLRNVYVPMNSFDVRQLHFDALVPAFVLPDKTQFVSANVLAAPFVMLLNGSSTPDPRLYQSGTQSLWNTLTANSLTLSKLRHGVLLQQTKNEKPDHDVKGQTPILSHDIRDDIGETKGDYEQFRCEL